MSDDTLQNEDLDPTELQEEESDLHQVKHVQSMFEDWFIDYASYVILDRAIPDLLDGLKPVQRRILHSMDELEDGRYNKVANVIGNTMKYHPHGDQSIGDAIVQLGQKMLTIDTQGNWGNIYTGDSAAAPRYIEARLSQFAKEVCFNHKTTEWKLSYDGRNKEPITLPIKFPLLLTQGVEGIAVGLNTKILPHNFNELIDASIAILKGKDFEIYPDFQNGGSIDVSRYNDGMRGGRVRVRAKISILDKRTLVITEIPFGTTTTALINDSIAPAIEKGKLKIRKIDDNTAATVEIILHLHQGVSPDQTIDALYAFTKCEVPHSPNACVLYENKPHFMSVKEILKINTEHTVSLLKKELEIQLAELEEDWHRWSLEKLFFEKRIYKELEKETATWEKQIDNIEKAFDPYRPLFKREITREDVLKLCEKPVRKISKFDIKKAEDQIANIEKMIQEVLHHLEHLIDYAIEYFTHLKEKYGAGFERKTEIKSFDTIDAAAVAVANQKLYMNAKEGFVGTGLKREDGVEYVDDCSDIDEVIVFRENGTFMVSKVSEKQFFGKGIIHVEIFKRNDDRTIYNMVYSDGPYGTAMVKRFNIGGVTRDREYDLTKGKEGSKVLYFTSNPNGEAEVIRVFLRAKPKLKKTQFEYDFSELAIRGRGAQGNILSKHTVRKIELYQKGVSTLSAMTIYFDEIVMKLNSEERGKKLGKFKEDDKIISIYKSGYYRVTGFDLSTHFEDSLLIIQKLDEEKPITVIYKHLKEDRIYMKRFLPENTDKIMEFLPDMKQNEVLHVMYDLAPMIEISVQPPKGKEIETEMISCSDFIDVMGIRAKGKRLHRYPVVEIKLLDSPEDEEEFDSDDSDEINGPDVEDVDIEEVEVDETDSETEETEEVEKNDEVEVIDEVEETKEEETEVEAVKEVEQEQEEQEQEVQEVKKVEVKEKTPAKKPQPKKNNNHNNDQDEWEQLTLF